MSLYNLNVSSGTAVSLWNMENVDEIYVKTIIATAKIGDCNDVRDFGRLNGSMNPSKIKLIKHTVPQGVGTILKSGWLIISGGENENEALALKLYFLRKLYNRGFNLRCRNYRIRRFLGVFKTSFKINLKKLVRRIGFKRCSHATEKYVKYHLVDKDIWIWIYASGNVAISGAKSRQNLQYAKNKVMRTLQLCRMN